MNPSLKDLIGSDSNLEEEKDLVKDILNTDDSEIQSPVYHNHK